MQMPHNVKWPNRLNSYLCTISDADFGTIQELSETEYKRQIERLVSSKPWEMPSQNNSYFQPLVEAAMYVYNNWTNGGKKTAQQITKVFYSDDRIKH